MFYRHDNTCSLIRHQDERRAVDAGLGRRQSGLLGDTPPSRESLNMAYIVQLDFVRCWAYNVPQPPHGEPVTQAPGQAL